MSNAEYLRSKLIVDIKEMSFKQTLDELELMRKKKSEYGRCPVVIIDHWIEQAEKEQIHLHAWFMRQFRVIPKSERLHDLHQRPIQEVFGFKDK